MFNAKFYARKGNQNVDSLCKMSFLCEKKCSFEATKRPYSLSTLCVSSEETSDVSQKTYFVESTFKKHSKKIRFMFGLLGSRSCLFPQLLFWHW